jgi:tRNA-splicing ligase RtcB
LHPAQFRPRGNFLKPYKNMSSINGDDIMNLGIPEGPLVGKALQIAKLHEEHPEEILSYIETIYENPEIFDKTDEKIQNAVENLEEADKIISRTEEFAEAVQSHKERQAFKEDAKPLDEPKDYAVFGLSLIPRNAIEQMDRAMRIPVAKAGALMPDAHLGYGLPVGGVWALDNALSPNAVGVDIGCRMKLTVYPINPDWPHSSDDLKDMIVENSHFGQGSGSDDVTDHRIFNRDEWDDIPGLSDLKDKARYQLGSSGGGNHFLEWCEVELMERISTRYGPVLPSDGPYLGLLSHSGSRGFGFKVAQKYTQIAEDRCFNLSGEMEKLAWLSLEEDSGKEYWHAMNLAGDYASACHEVIHDQVSSALGVGEILSEEHHHNFAWEETHKGETVMVHRKGATPAYEGMIGIIPGTMADDAYLVRGHGNEDSIQSCSHGAGRKMSRTEAKEKIDERSLEYRMDRRNAELIGGGLDEHPEAYKNIDEVMSVQSDLCHPIARITPRIVRMAE